MTSPYVLIFLFVTIVAASQQADVNLNNDADCEAQFSRCERELHDLRKQRERAKAKSHKLIFQLWRLTLVQKTLNNEVRVLRHQVENPDEPVPPVEISSSGTGQMYVNCDLANGYVQSKTSNYLKDIDLLTSNCTLNLESCRSSQNRERESIQDFEREAEDQRSAIADQTRINDELRATAAELKCQLAARNVTPHPNSQLGDINIPSSAEHDIDSEEVERRVAATVDRVDQRSR